VEQAEGAREVTQPTTTRFEARSYELDPYGHLNNAVFVNWFEHGRLCYLRDRGLTYMSVPADFGVRIVVVQQDITYRAEVNLGDELDLATTIERFGNSSFTFRHELTFAAGGVAGLGKVTMVCTKDGRSTSMPDALRAKLQ
jgi:YbgC/YbaW family acyl-CoA thioester hydrolase